MACTIRADEWSVDYSTIADAFSGAIEYANAVVGIVGKLEDVWFEKYLRMTPARHCVDILQVGTFSYSFDNPPFTREDDFVWNEDVEERTVVAYGIAIHAKGKRDRNRMRGPRGEREWSETQDGYCYDRGHLIAHSIGGIEDFGLFPQRRDINQGRSPRGRVFRSMETYCLHNPGVFCFARPIYLDRSSHPFYLEYGVLRPDMNLWVEVFENRYTDRLFTYPYHPQPEKE